MNTPFAVSETFGLQVLNPWKIELGSFPFEDGTVELVVDAATVVTFGVSATPDVLRSVAKIVVPALAALAKLNLEIEIISC